MTFTGKETDVQSGNKVTIADGEDDLGESKKHDEQNSKSSDLLSGSSLPHRNVVYKKIITPKLVISMNKHIPQRHQLNDQHSLNNSFIPEEKNENKQSTTSIDPCTVTQDEQSIITNQMESLALLGFLTDHVRISLTKYDFAVLYLKYSSSHKESLTYF
ncbi:unnamed protein product [Schistosoma mattheei]|uniref:Uncharacterized protein n=1 Tax=Schistosoma mattheei TaxID=31246 RepID=A0A183NMQ1_9TREM|nr:unnamed protein product [Schistosoma mattheei]